MFDAEQKKMKTGDLGEKLVAKYYRTLGNIVEESLDLFDYEKDMMVDINRCEVKTQQRWHLQNAFTINPNQLKKCQEVDLLIIVETPSKYNNMTVVLYDFPKDQRKFYKKRTNDGRMMYCIKTTLGKVLTTYTNPGIINQFTRYSNSSWV